MGIETRRQCDYVVFYFNENSQCLLSTIVALPV